MQLILVLVLPPPQLSVKHLEPLLSRYTTLNLEIATSFVSVWSVVSFAAYQKNLILYLFAYQYASPLSSTSLNDNKVWLSNVYLF